MAVKEVAIIGAGVVGSAIGYLLKRKGYRIRGIFSRTLRSSKQSAEFIGVPSYDEDIATTAGSADLVFLTVPDRFIAPVCHEIVAKNGFREGAIVLHTSGSLASTVLNEAHSCGALVGSIHPLMSFATAKDAVTQFHGVYCSHESDPEAEPVLKQLIHAMGGIPVGLTAANKPLYHAAATTAANFFVTLLGISQELLSVGTAGGHQQLLAPLLPLVKSVLANVEELGLPDALTGPIARGEADVVRSHVEAIGEQAPRYLDAYRELGKLTISLGLEKGTLSSEIAEEIHVILEATNATTSQ